MPNILELGAGEQRLDDAERELSARADADAKLERETFNAAISGNSDAADDFAAQRVKNQMKMHQIALAIEGPPGKAQLGLRYLAAVEERGRLIAELAAANERVQANGVAIREQNAKLERLQKELDGEVKLAEKLRANGCGHYEAARDLKIHRTKFPDIEEAN